MQIGWKSRQGRSNKSNNDAVAVSQRQQFWLAMLVDAAEKGQGQRLAQHWCQTIIQSAVAASQPLNTDELVRIMRAEQQLLRHEHLLAIASYCCLLIDLQEQQLHVLHVGDCMAGLKLGADTCWLTRPHTVAAQPFWPSEVSPSPESRHLLTRSLNAKRFVRPECRTVPLPPDARILVCSDGYLQGEDQRDDVSQLILRPGGSGAEIETDAANFFFISLE